MTSRSSYRVKVDLSKYHHDVRRFSWIYVNSTNIWSIGNLKQHIKDVFGIAEPFHLLLNGDEYLPPNEDVRVLNADEVIVVKPGTGIHENGSSDTFAVPTPLPYVENGRTQPMETNLVPPEKKSKIQVSPEQNNEDALNTSVTSPSNNLSRVDATLYHSLMDVTGEESESDSIQKIDDSVSGSAEELSCSSAHKRKRVRRKKSSKQAKETSLDENIDVQKQKSFDKPKVIQIHTIQRGKHIRFNVEQKVEELKNTANEQPPEPVNKNPNSITLSSLLALGKCSTPLSFANGKKRKVETVYNVKNTMESENPQNDCPPVSIPAIHVSPVKKVENGSKNDDQQSEYADIKPEDYPPLTETKINDIVAFKVLRMGSEYTPEESNYIVAKTVAYCPTKQLYTFQIIRGQEEILCRTPGKFDLPEDETEMPKTNTVDYNFTQLREARLIKRAPIDISSLD